MKKCLLLLIISLCNITSAMETIQLPSKEKLDERFLSIGLSNFAKKHQIPDTLGGKNFTPQQVITIIDKAIDTMKPSPDEQSSSLRFKIYEQYTTFLKPMMIEIVLENHPQVIAQLKKDDLLK